MVPRHSGPSSIDRHVGARVRALRTGRGMSQEVLGHLLGVSPQQIYKYETGRNGLSATRLWHVAAILGVSVNDLFDHAPPPAALPGERQEGDA